MNTLEVKPLESTLRPILSVLRKKYRIAVGLDDLVQETLLRALKQPPTESIEGWCWKIGRNVCIDLYRKQAREKDASERFLLDLEDKGPDYAGLLEEVLQGASWEVKKVARLYTYGYSGEEIARECGISTRQVRRRLAVLRNSVTHVTNMK